MTLVHVDLRKPQRGTEVRAPVKGVISARLLRREVEGSYYLLPTSYEQVLVEGECTLSLTPTDGTNAWVLEENVKDGRTRVVEVPNTTSTVEYVDLVEVDPATL